VESGQSTLSTAQEIQLPTDTARSVAVVRADFRRRFAGPRASTKLAVAVEPIVWQQGGDLVAALAVWVTDYPRGIFRRFIVDEHSADVLHELKRVRNLTAPNSIFAVSPKASNDGTEGVTLSALSALDELQSAN